MVKKIVRVLEKQRFLFFFFLGRNIYKLGKFVVGRMRNQGEEDGGSFRKCITGWDKV